MTTTTSAHEDPPVCRDEHCLRDDVHPPHRVARRSAKVQQAKRSYARRPWLRPDPVGLREAIYAAISGSTARTFSEIYRQVLDDFGSCTGRAVHRHLIWLRDQGRIVRLEFAEHRLFAYLRAGSKLADDPGFVREQLLAAFTPQKGPR